MHPSQLHTPAVIHALQTLSHFALHHLVTSILSRLVVSVPAGALALFISLHPSVPAMVRSSVRLPSVVLAVLLTAVAAQMAPTYSSSSSSSSSPFSSSSSSSFPSSSSSSVSSSSSSLASSYSSSPFSWSSSSVSVSPPPPGSLYWYSYCAASNKTGAVWSVSASGFLSLNLSAGVTVDTEWTGYPVLFINGSRLYQDYLTGVQQNSSVLGLDINRANGAADQLLRQTFAGWSPDSKGLAFVMSPAANLPLINTASVITLANGEFAQDATSTIVENGFAPNGQTQFQLLTVSSTFQQPAACQQLPPMLPQAQAYPAPPSEAVFNWTYCAASNTSVGGAWSVSAFGSLVVDTSALVTAFTALSGQSNSYQTLYQSFPILSFTGQRNFTDYSSGVPVQSTSTIVGLVANTTNSLFFNYAGVSSTGQVSYGYQYLAQPIDFRVSPAAVLPYGTLNSTIFVTSSVVENGITGTQQAGDVVSSQFNFYSPSQGFFNYQQQQQACVLTPQPRTPITIPPTQAVFNWTYCAASNTSVGGAWSVSAFGSLVVDTSALVTAFTALSGQSNSYQTLYQSFPILSFTGQRNFTDYSSGVPVQSTSTIVGLVANTTNSLFFNYAGVSSTGQVSYGYQYLAQSVHLQLAAPSFLPLGAMADRLTVTQSASENSNTVSGGSQFTFYSPMQDFFYYQQQACTIAVPAETFPGQVQLGGAVSSSSSIGSTSYQSSGPPPATLTVYFQYCQVSNTTSAAFSVSFTGSAVVNNSAAVSAYWSQQGSSGYSYFYQPSLFPILSLQGVRVFVDYTFGSGNTTTNITLAPLSTNQTYNGSSSVAVSNTFNLAGYVAGPQSSSQYFWSTSLYSGGLQLVSSPPAVLVQSASLNSSSQLTLSQSSGVLQENGEALAVLLGDTEQWTLQVSTYPFSACSLTVQPRIAPPPPTTTAYFSYCSASNTSQNGAWSVSVQGVMQLNNSAAQQAYGQWSSNAQSGTNYAYYNYPTLFKVLAINGSRSFTQYGANGLPISNSTANIAGLVAQATNATASANQTGVPTQTLSTYGELYSDGYHFQSNWWSVAPWQGGIQYALSTPAALPGGLTASTVTLSSSLSENGVPLTYSAQDTSSWQFELQPYPLYSACVQQPQPRTPPPASRVQLSWTYCSSFNTTVDGAWTVQASGVLLLDSSAIVAQYNTLLGSYGEITVQQMLPVLSMTGSRTFVDYSSGVPVSTTSNITGLLANSSSSLSVYAYVYGSGYVDYSVQGVSPAGLSFTVSPAAAMPANQTTPTITLTSGNVENALSVPYTRGDVQTTQFYASTNGNSFTPLDQPHSHSRSLLSSDRCADADVYILTYSCPSILSKHP